MRFRITRALAGCALAVLTVAGCGGDDEPGAAADDTTAGATAPSDDATEEPSVEPSEAPSVPTDLPTDIPSELPTELPTDIDFGDCEELYTSMLEASTAMEGAMADPTAAQGLFAQIAQTLRDGAQGLDADIVAAAEELASVYDDMGAGLASGEMPDVARMQGAATAMQTACTN